MSWNFVFTVALYLGHTHLIPFAELSVESYHTCPCKVIIVEIQYSVNDQSLK